MPGRERFRKIFKHKFLFYDIINGKYQAFYKNGNIKEELDFVNNVENGDFKQYYEKGWKFFYITYIKRI